VLPEVLGERDGGGLKRDWELRAVDCLGGGGLETLGDDSIDVGILDPPYSEHVHAKSRRGLTVTHAGGKQDEISERRDLGFEHITTDEMERTADHLARVVKRWSLVFCDVESVHLWRGALSSAGLEVPRTCGSEQPATVIWHKLGGAPQFTGDRPTVAFEAIVVAHRPGKKRWNGGGKAGWYAHPTAIDRDRSGLDERMHTTQKPVSLMEDLIRDFSDPGELILDPYAGSGTTLLAALRLGRRAIGFERDPAIHAVATKRLRGERVLPSAFHDERQGSLL
jgi:site-specific DNA-methyltransferase (adenine-specific)